MRKLMVFGKLFLMWEIISPELVFSSQPRVRHSIKISKCIKDKFSIFHNEIRAHHRIACKIPLNQFRVFCASMLICALVSQLM